MRTKRLRVGSKYLFTFIDANNNFTFKKPSGKIMAWTKKEIVYIQKAMNVMGVDYIKQYYCK